MLGSLFVFSCYDQPTLFSMPLVDFDLAGRVEAHDVVRLRMGALHTRRPGRHAGDRNPLDRRTLAQQALDGVGRDVAFDDVSTDERRMTRTELYRQAVRGFDLVETQLVVRLHREAAVAQMLHPLSAAAALRIFVNDDVSRRSFLPERSVDGNENHDDRRDRDEDDCQF